MYIWDMSKKAEDTGKKHSLLRDPKYVLFENVIITAVHVDKNIIAVGDNTGRITVLTAGGKEVYALNSTSHSAATTAAAAAAAADPATVPLSKLRSVYKHKINDITRAGRWVVASDNNGHAYLCDIFTPEQTDPPEFTAPSGGQVKEVRVSNGKIVVLSHPKKESRTGFKTSKNRPDVAYWTPPQLKPNMFGSSVDHVQNWGDSPLELLSITLAKLYMSQAASALPLSRYSERLRTITRFLNEAATKEGQTEITVPFLLVQHAQKTLDAFVDLVALSEKTGKSRHKEGVPIAAKAFFRAISAMSAILEASEAPFRVKNYFESQDTQGKEAGTGPEEEAGNSPKRTNGAQRRMSLKVIRRGSDAEMDAPQKHFISQSGLHVQQKAIQENPSTNSENGATASSQGNTGVEGMLEGLDKTLTRMHKKVEEAITTFDEACSEGPLEHDKATQLLKVYSSLCQFNEDFKEMGKDIAEIRGVAPSSECPGTEPWYENGGNYEDEPASSSTGTSGGLSQGSESSLSALSTN